MEFLFTALHQWYIGFIAQTHVQLITIHQEDWHLYHLMFSLLVYQLYLKLSPIEHKLFWLLNQNISHSFTWLILPPSLVILIEFVIKQLLLLREFFILLLVIQEQDFKLFRTHDLLFTSVNHQSFRWFFDKCCRKLFHEWLGFQDRRAFSGCVPLESFNQCQWNLSSSILLANFLSKFLILWRSCCKCSLPFYFYEAI